LLRRRAEESAGSSQRVVLMAPSTPAKPELEDIAVRFEFALPGADELRDLLKRLVRRFPRERTRVELTREDAEGIVSDLQGLTMFEAERALARAVVEDNALTAADRP